MGSCSSAAPSEGALVRHQEINPQYSDQTQAETPAMDERTQKADINYFMEANNAVVKMVKEKFEDYDALQKRFYDLDASYKQSKEENQSLRQRINNDSEMNHRSYQSNSEDVTSRNKRSDVLKRYQGMDGTKRRQAIEAFGEHRADRTELWYRKDLTCRIFVTAYDIASYTKDAFNQQALPKFFQCAPSVGVNYEESEAISAEASQLIQRGMQQSISAEMQSLLSAEFFKVACSSVLKEMAVNCDLTDLEKRMLRELTKKRDQWRKSEPWLPHLDDEIISRTSMKNYITECVRIAWRMVNLLPPLKIVQVNQVHGDKFDDFFQTEKEEAKEKTPTMTVCVWPALTDYDGDEVFVKGTAVIIPKPKRQQGLQEHAV
ncbi:hypothetical protein ACROYT_G029560 [Oculina patagonica]